jgi:hypothetical protein
MKLPAFLLPVLFVFGAPLGGWYLIPADLAWLLIEFAERPRVPAEDAVGPRSRAFAAKPSSPS